MTNPSDMRQEAKAFIEDARRTRALSGKSLAGRRYLTDAQHRAIDKAVKQLSLSGRFNAFGGHEAATTLLISFEELCRRNKITLPDTLRPFISSILVEELFTNGRVFLKQPEEKALQQLVSLTLYNGTSFANIHDDPEFAEFRDTPWFFKHAAVSYPSDPRKFLRDVQATIAALATEEEFADFRDTPWIFKRAAAHNPSDPRGFLRRAQKTIAALATEEEFADFRDTPGIFRLAAVGNPSDPRGFLRGVQAEKEAAPKL